MLQPRKVVKLSAQISVLMANKSTDSVDDPAGRSYQQKGTFATAKNIVLHRGFGGLYSGFGLHSRKCRVQCRLLILWEQN